MITFTLPHWCLVLAWWIELLSTVLSFGSYLHRVAGGNYNIEPPKTASGRAWLAGLYLVLVGCVVIVLALARRAL